MNIPFQKGKCEVKVGTCPSGPLGLKEIFNINSTMPQESREIGKEYTGGQLPEMQGGHHGL